MAQTTSDNKEKMQALEYYRQAHMDLMAMLREGGFNMEYYMVKEKEREKEQENSSSIKVINT